jgi:hypothetical protein
VSWASPGPAVRPRVLLRPGHAVPAVPRTYTDGLNGETVWTYHAEIGGLAPGSTHQYTVTADNDSSATPFASTFSTAPRGRAPFRFTSFGDLATPNTQWVLSYGQSAHAVAAVESFQPLFHLLNGDLCYADLNPTLRPHPVTTDDTGVFDTSRGTVHLVLGCGGTDANLDDYGVETADGMRQAKVFTQPNRPVATSTPGVFARPAADAVEDAPWSARRDTATGYGIAVFDVDPGEPGGMTSIKVTHYHAVGADPVNPTTGEPGAPTPDYTEFETFTLVRRRSDRPGRRAAPEQAPVSVPGG